jgi:hypothetical protein
MRNRFTVRGMVAAVAMMAAAPVAVLALGAGPASASISPGPTPAPVPGTCEPVRVTTAELVQTGHGPVIRVTGIKAHQDDFLRLDADDIDFIIQPDFFPYTVNGCGSGGPVVKTPFVQDFAVPRSPVGKCGIEVSGIPVVLFRCHIAAG